MICDLRLAIGELRLGPQMTQQSAEGFPGLKRRRPAVSLRSPSRRSHGSSSGLGTPKACASKGTAEH
jgi:hypothetical protein